MAEIHVEPKRRSLTWLWVVIALLIIIGLIWYFMSNRGAGTTSLRDVPPIHLAQHAHVWARALAA